MRFGWSWLGLPVFGWVKLKTRFQVKCRFPPHVFTILGQSAYLRYILPMVDERNIRDVSRNLLGPQLRIVTATFAYTPWTKAHYTLYIYIYIHFTEVGGFEESHGDSLGRKKWFKLPWWRVGDRKQINIYTKYMKQVNDIENEEKE